LAIQSYKFHKPSGWPGELAAVISLIYCYIENIYYVIDSRGGHVYTN